LRLASACRLFCKYREEKICSDADFIGMSSATLNRRHLIGSLTAPPDRSQEAGLFANDMAPVRVS
jgi:hypothetical protein